MKKCFYILLFILLASVGYQHIYRNVPDSVLVDNRIDFQVKEVKIIISTSSKYNENVAF